MIGNLKVNLIEFRIGEEKIGDVVIAEPRTLVAVYDERDRTEQEVRRFIDLYVRDCLTEEFVALGAKIAVMPKHTWNAVFRSVKEVFEAIDEHANE